MRTRSEGGQDEYARRLKVDGSVLLPPDTFFNLIELEQLFGYQCELPDEHVTAGDAGDTHELIVRRIIIDPPGQFPRRVNQPQSDKILSLLEDERRGEFFFGL